MSGSRRQNLEGTFENLKNGKVKAYVRTKVGETTIKKSATGNNKSEALAALRRKLREKNRPESSDQSFTISARSWLTNSRKLSPTTRDIYTIWIDQIERDKLGSLPILAITESDLRLWVNRQPQSTTTTKKRLAFIHQMLRAHGNQTRIKPPKQSENPRRPLAPDERQAVLDLLDKMDERVRRAILLSWFAGLRRSELLGLKHGDREGDGIRIHRVVVVTRDAVIVRSRAKTAASHGWVPLPPILQEMIGPQHGSGYVVTGTDRPMNPKTLSDLVSQELKPLKSNVPHLGLHAFRRTYGMMLLESGADVVTAAQAMRHDPTMLMKEYARSRQDLMSSAVQRAFSPDTAPSTAPSTAPNNSELG